MTQPRELGINNVEDKTALDLQRAVQQAMNRTVPAPRPPPDQITRTRPVPRPRTQRPVPAPRQGRPKTASQIFLQQKNLPILRPTPPTKTSNVESIKQLVGRVVELVKNQLNKFANQILPYVPESVKRTVNQRVEKLEYKVNEIYEQIRSDKFKPREHEVILKGYMKTFRIDGQKGVDDHTFTIIILKSE